MGRRKKPTKRGSRVIDDFAVVPEATDRRGEWFGPLAPADGGLRRFPSIRCRLVTPLLLATALLGSLSVAARGAPGDLDPALGLEAPS